MAKDLDSVNHRILIGRLNSFGFSNDCLVWFTNYFSDRVQCVKSDGLLSGPGSLYGGATGFNSQADYFLCTYQWWRSCCWWLFDPPPSDDTILYTSSLDTVLTNLQTNSNAVQHSFCGLQLLLNASQTKCMLFNRSLPAPACPSSITTLVGSDLEYVDNYKYLGVWLDCKLSFQTHIKHLNPKLNLESASYFAQSILHSCCQT